MFSLTSKIYLKNISWNVRMKSLKYMDFKYSTKPCKIITIKKKRKVHKNLCSNHNLPITETHIMLIRKGSLHQVQSGGQNVMIKWKHKTESKNVNKTNKIHNINIITSSTFH